MTQFNKAEAQRRLKVLGAQFEVEWYNSETKEWYNKQYRTIAHVQGNAFAGVKALVNKEDPAYQLVNSNPHRNGSWLWFDDKHTKYLCGEDGSVTLISTYEGRNEPVLKYVPVEQKG